MSRKLASAALLGSLGLGTAFGGQTVAIIDTDHFIPSLAAGWCAFLQQHGHPCTTFPTSGPTGPLNVFDVVIDMSELWTDPAGELADLMVVGKTVITWGEAPRALGINANPTVQAWIGANEYSGGTEDIITTATDPLLGDIPPGTKIADVNTSLGWGLRYSSGHPHARVLAIWSHPTYVNPKAIGLLRNFWGNGASVYLSDSIYGNTLGQILLNAVRIQQLIPTTSTWGLLVMALATVTAGTVIIRRRRLLPWS